ncbi:hypothetical protein BFP70_05210 [Thioclava sp. SK-1]|uniref:hypothetical protein n=1 Tax=Thioclava sp. SK-1 TaxID=1889770 RepID=UPI000826FAFF|nr:hypothetical protein [Thioclava sp. SK-1]OCX66421.1 hypothetical protein BFP70_05210 [Thioclava sp. SK-1]
MRDAFKTLGLVAILLIGLDGVLAAVLSGPAPNSLKRFFEYGRSVPGKIALWQATPGQPGDMTNVSWRDEILAKSRAEFATEDSTSVLRVYGMSFVDQIARAAQKVDPALIVDLHSGPAAPPNFTYAMAQDDRVNRRAGDVVIWGVLSSSVPAMASYSNRVWQFEQPAPFTYPVYHPDSTGLRRQDPVLTTQAQQHLLATDPDLQRAWDRQLHDTDALYVPAAFMWPWLDISPFARLIRRALVTGEIADRKARIIAQPKAGPYPYQNVLQGMALNLAQQARADGQILIVVLAQTGDPRDVDLLALLGPFLEQHGIPYLATAKVQDPRDARAFIPDGHYTDAVNARFGAAVVDLLNRLGMPPS